MKGQNLIIVIKNLTCAVSKNIQLVHFGSMEPSSVTVKSEKMYLDTTEVKI